MEQLNELDQKEKQVEKEKQVTTMLKKFRVEWMQLYPRLVHNASSSCVTGGCTNLKIDNLHNTLRCFLVSGYFSLIVARAIFGNEGDLF